MISNCSKFQSSKLIGCLTSTITICLVIITICLYQWHPSLKVVTKVKEYKENKTFSEGKKSEYKTILLAPQLEPEEYSSQTPTTFSDVLLKYAREAEEGERKAQQLRSKFNM